MSIIALNHVSFKYHSDLVLEDISFEVEKGDFVGLIGPNGSGKSTILKILLGLLSPAKGEVKLFGQKISEFKDWKKIGYVPQKASISSVRFPITVEEVVGLNAVNQTAVKRALELVGMEKHSKELLNELSGGQQQRVFIARALVTEPEILILDEPTVGVDTAAQTKFYELLKTLNQKQNLTLILVSHDLDVVTHEVKTIFCINKTLIFHGKPKEIAKNGLMQKLYGKNAKLVVHGH